DGSGCLNVPFMSGIKADGTPVYKTSNDASCGNKDYTTGSFAVPAGPLAAKSVVIATNGGSDYIYIPDHDATTFQNLVTALQTREEVGAIFVNDTQYTVPNGTVGMSKVKLYSNAARTPDIIFSYMWDDTQVVAGLPGIEFESMAAGSNRGMHGSFSPVDVHNT